MSASGKLNVLEQHAPGNHWDAEVSATLRNALPQIRAVVEAAEAAGATAELLADGTDSEFVAVPVHEIQATRSALSALDLALTTKGER